MSMEVLDCHFVNAQDLTKPEHQLQSFFDTQYGFQVQAIRMNHSFPCYGLIITANQWKFVYSADSRPCTKLIELGTNATLLVHECTFDDEDDVRASKTNHSTLTQALDVACKM